jgi:hypothetical protein
MAEQNIPELKIPKIPENGIIVKLMPDGDQAPQSQKTPQSQKKLRPIQNAYGSSIGVGDNEPRITTHKDLKIYDDSTGNTFRLWRDYMPPGQMLSEENQKLLEQKFVDVNDIAKNPIGGRSSRKKYKKSSKRKHGRSMKRNASSNSRKYSRRK